MSAYPGDYGNSNSTSLAYISETKQLDQILKQSTIRPIILCQNGNDIHDCCFTCIAHANVMCDTLDYSVYCPFVVYTLYQPCAKMNFTFFGRSYLSTPKCLRFQNDAIRLSKDMDCGCAQVLVLICRLLICPNYKVTVNQIISRKCSLIKLDCSEESTQGEDFPANIHSSATSQSVVKW